jgi:hypothetical protein
MMSQNEDLAEQEKVILFQSCIPFESKKKINLLDMVAYVCNPS